MSKAGRILLLVAAIFAITGATHKTHAQATVGMGSAYSKTLPDVNVNVSSGLAFSPYLMTSKAKLYSTVFCQNDGTERCVPETEENLRQVQSAVVIARPEQRQHGSGIKLNSAYAKDDAVLNSDRIFDLVNQYRQSRSFAPFEKEPRVCELAQARSTEIIGEIAKGILHSGLYNRNLPYWIWENAKVGSNEEGAVAWWLSSPIHYSSIVGDYKYSCVKCTGSYCSQLFTSFSPK